MNKDQFYTGIKLIEVASQKSLEGSFVDLLWEHFNGETSWAWEQATKQLSSYGKSKHKLCLKDFVLSVGEVKYQVGRDDRRQQREDAKKDGIPLTRMLELAREEAARGNVIMQRWLDDHDRHQNLSNQKGVSNG